MTNRSKIMDKYFFIVDGNSFMHRSFNAIPPLTNKDGFPTNAITGTSNMINSLIKNFSPENIVVAFDVGKKNFRHDIFSEYKKNRKSTDPDLKIQFSVMKEIIDLWGIKRLEVEGCEADDSMATLARIASENGYIVVIVTSDKDLKQIVNDKILMLDTKEADKNPQPYGIQGVFEREGVYPKNIIDKLSLMGDKADDIIGIEGIGDKTAVKLLVKYGNGEEIFKNTHNEKGVLKSRLENGKEIFDLAKKLVTIDQYVNVLPIEFYKKEELKREEMASKLYEYGLKTLIKSIGLNEEMDKKKVSLVAELIIVNKDNFKEITSLLNNAEKLYLLNKNDTVFLSTNGLNVYLFDINDIFFRTILKDVMDYANEKNRVIVSYLMKDFVKKMNKYNIKVDNILDISIIKFVLNGGDKKEFTLEDFYEEYFGTPISLNNDSERVLVLKMIYEEQLKIIEEDSTLIEILNIEMELLKVICSMEDKGVCLSAEVLEKVGENFDEKIKELEKEIYVCAGQKFNINSPKQVSHILFDVLQLKSKKKSTGEDVLKAISDQNIVVNKILNYRSIYKIKSTYIIGLMKHIDGDGKVHTNYNQTIVSTGRLSSIEPNLQNIPVKTEEGRKIRSAFIASKGCKLVLFDYSQIELRILAHMSNESKLIYAYNNNIDIHSLTASEVLGKKLSEITKEDRNIGKGINFGLIYGMSGKKMAEDLSIEVKDANKYKKLYFEKYKEIKPFMQKELDFVRENFYTKTLSNRKIHIPSINSTDSFIRSHAEKSANNASIQGTAAEIIKLAMIDSFKYIVDNNINANLLMQIHDELIFEVEDKDVILFEKKIVEIMEKIYKLNVPLKVESRISNSY